MSGPALRSVGSHHAIHQNAWNEADEALRAARAVHAASDHARFAAVVEVFVEIVEARILVHAGEEERGLYQEWLRDIPERKSAVHALSLEHEALRRLTAAVEEAMVRQDYDAAIARMSQLLQVSADHSQHEEDVLCHLPGQPVS